MAKVGRPKKPKIKKLIKDIMPLEAVFSDDEKSMYDDYLLAYLNDFDADELTSSDMDDIMSLAMNKVLAYRLLKESKDDVGAQIDVATSMEKLDKRNEKIKESLSTRRKDRIDPNTFKGFSIVDLAVALDQDVKRAHTERLERLRAEEKEMLKKRESYSGNRSEANETDGDKGN